MYPFERFTDSAKRALTLAQQEAEGSRQSYVGTEHLLLGMLGQPECLAARILTGLGVDLEGARAGIEATVKKEEGVSIAQITPTSRVKTAIEHAFEEARAAGKSHVGTERLLLGIMLDPQAVATVLLRDRGITTAKVRQQIERLEASGSAEAVSSPTLSAPETFKTVRVGKGTWYAIQTHQWVLNYPDRRGQPLHFTLTFPASYTAEECERLAVELTAAMRLALDKPDPSA